MNAARSLTPLILSFVVGTAISLTLCAALRPLVETGTPATPSLAGPPVTSLPVLEKFTAPPRDWSDADFRSLRKSLTGISADLLSKNLEQALLLPPASRRTALALQLAHWARQDARAAMEWMMEHAEGQDRDFLFQEIGPVWAGQDVKEFAAWTVAFLEQNPAVVLALVWQAAEMIHPRDPLLYAEILAHPAAEKAQFQSPWTGVLSSIPDLASARRYAVASEGKLNYQKEAPGSSARKRMASPGWNSVAEASAIRWHLLDAAGCEEWLSRQPELAQENLRTAIAENEPKTAAAAAKAEPPPVPFLRTEPDVIPPPTAFKAYHRQWADWWREEPVAAEHFLQQAAWPEDWKFRARATAYASPP